MLRSTARTGWFAYLILLMAAVGAVPAQAQPLATATPARIDLFRVEPAPRLRPGHHVHLVLYGSPGAVVQVRLEGGPDKFKLHESPEGVYRGTYAVKQSDRLATGGMVTASLYLHQGVATAVLDQSLLEGGESRSDARRAAQRTSALPAIAPTSSD